MQFPFIAPFKSWVKQKLEHRESNTNLSAFVSPWIMLTSFSIVAKLNGKNEEPTPTDITSKAGSAQVKYNGCIISSTTDIKKQYTKFQHLVEYSK